MNLTSHHKAFFDQRKSVASRATTTQNSLYEDFKHYLSFAKRIQEEAAHKSYVLNMGATFKEAAVVDFSDEALAILEEQRLSA
jgi:hypothetical protein